MLIKGIYWNLSKSCYDDGIGTKKKEKELKNLNIFNSDMRRHQADGGAVGA